MPSMMHLLAALAVAGFAGAASANTWTGTADYTQAPNGATAGELVGPFDTYDFARGAVLLEPTVFDTNGVAQEYDGWYQSYVTNHQLLGELAAAPGLNLDYEITVTASFHEVVDLSSNLFELNSGSVELRFDSIVNRDFATDAGFADGHVLMTGTIIAGSGALFEVGGRSVGFTDLTLRVDSFDSNVFEPDSIAAGSSIFTLRLNDPADETFIGNVASVLGHTYDGGDVRLAADGYLVLQVPEPRSYAMLLAGIGLIGLVTHRRLK